MEYRNLHPWRVSPKEAIEIQNALRSHLILDQSPDNIETVAGIDVSSEIHSNRLFAAVVVCDLKYKTEKSLPILEVAADSLDVDLPSIGCGKTLLTGRYHDPGPLRGERVQLVDRGETIGAILRSKEKVAPIYISPGLRMTLDRAVVSVFVCLF